MFKHYFALCTRENPTPSALAQAQFKLALCYMTSIGVDNKDDKAGNRKEAFRLMTLTANQGFAPAQYMLAEWLTGIGVGNNTDEEKARNKATAIEWLTKAAAQGHEEAKKMLGRLQSQPSTSSSPIPLSDPFALMRLTAAQNFAPLSTSTSTATSAATSTSTPNPTTNN